MRGMLTNTVMIAWESCPLGLGILVRIGLGKLKNELCYAGFRFGLNIFQKPLKE